MGFIPLPLGSLVSNYNSRWLFVCFFFLLSIAEVKVIPDFIGKTRTPPVPRKGSFFFFFCTFAGKRLLYGGTSAREARQQSTIGKENC